MKTILIDEDVALNRELLVQLLEGDYRLQIVAKPIDETVLFGTLARHLGA